MKARIESTMFCLLAARAFLAAATHKRKQAPCDSTEEVAGYIYIEREREYIEIDR